MALLLGLLSIPGSAFGASLGVLLHRRADMAILGLAIWLCVLLLLLLLR